MDMIERVARALFQSRCYEPEHEAFWPDRIDELVTGPPFDADGYKVMARAAVTVVIEDCALVAESESTDGSEWIVARIAGRIRSAPEDSATQAELEKMCSPSA